MAMVMYDGNRSMVKRKNGKKKRSALRNELNIFAAELGREALNGLTGMAANAVKGIASAFRQKGASREEIKQLVAPLARTMRYGSKSPKFSNVSGGIQIEHIEMFDVTASYFTQIIDTNTFSWLKSIANQFEEYQIKLAFAWNPICPATTTGSVMMAFDYDPVDNEPGSYLNSQDFFNTADHCISALWSPAAISPNISGWLKTGSFGDLRLLSPGRFHSFVSDITTGFMTVKYQVSLRKPQPSQPNTSFSFGGLYTTTTGIFGGNGNFLGNPDLVQSITSTTLTMALTSGWKIVTWSTDATVASVVPSVTNGTVMGTRTGAGAVFVVRVPPGVGTIISGTVSTPGGATSYLVTVYQEDANPLYFPYP